MRISDWSSDVCSSDLIGGPARPQQPPHPLPERAPDGTVSLPTVPQQALIYRLSGDYNPLHADPEEARRVGFDRPILQGLSTFGVATHGLLKAVCGYEPRSEEHQSELQSLMGLSYAVFCL